MYDVAIIGGGPAGYTAAIRAGQYGLKVALIEEIRKAGRHLPPRRLHPDQVAAVQCRDLRLPEAREGIRHRGAGRRQGELAGGARSQEPDHRQAREGPRLPDAEEQGHRRAWLGQAHRAGEGRRTHHRSRRRQRREQRPGEERDSRDRLRREDAARHDRGRYRS